MTEQFKTTDDLREYIKTLGTFRARPTMSNEHPTLYLDHSQGPMIHGIREKDYFFNCCRKNTNRTISTKTYLGC